MAEILGHSRARNEAMLAGLTQAERETLMRLLRRVLRTSRAHLAALGGDDET